MSDKFPLNHFFTDDSAESDSEKTKEDMGGLGNFMTDFPTPANIQPNVQDTDGFDAEELKTIDDGIQSYLREVIRPNKFQTYFDHNFNLVDIKENEVVFTTTTPFIKNMIESHYQEQISEAIVSVLGKRYAINIAVGSNPTTSLSSNDNNLLRSLSEDSDLAKKKTAADTSFMLDLNETKEDLEGKINSQYINHMNPIQNGTAIDPNKTFDNFIVGQSNNLAYATANAIADRPGKDGKYPSLYYYSNSGLGKTHLLHAIANRIREHHPHKVIGLITARQFIDDMIRYIRDKKLDEFQRKFSEQIDILMIDDVHVISGKEGTQNQFFHIFNKLYENGKQLVFTSDKSPEDIKGLEERIRTRFQWGLVVDIQIPDLETRIAILKSKASELDLYLPDDVINLMASSIKNNIRELEGALLRLLAYADLMKVEIDVEMAKDYLKLSPQSEEHIKVTLDSIAKSVSKHFKIQVADLKSPARTKEITRARHVAMYLSKKIINSTYEEIARFYNRKDHSTIIHAVKNITKQLRDNAELSKDITIIESDLN